MSSLELQQLAQQINRDWPTAVTQTFSGHPLAQLFRGEFKNQVDSIVNQFDSTYLTKASVGAGNWANVPWLSILNPELTTTTQNGIYPVYLFRADGSGFYLSLNQGTTLPAKELGKSKATRQAQLIKEHLLQTIPELDSWGETEIALMATTSLGQSYEQSNISAKFYPADNIPSSEVLEKDLITLLGIYQQIKAMPLDTPQRQTSEVQQPVKPLRASKVDIHLSKPFILLAGISGTGKTRFVREQAERQEGGDSRDNYCLVSVRPDWHEPSDLLGYVSRLGTQPNYIATDVLRFMVSAWKEIISDIVFEEEVPVEWRGKQLENIRPFWLCLDEMNLAPVEQYFADYLSVLETRSWTAKGKISDPNKSYEYDCDPLVSATLLSSLDSQACPEQEKRPTEILAQDLGLNLEDDLDSAIWRYFLRYGISIPFNLIVAGTVNMDETTHGFSRKVIDRALTFDFGEFFPNDFQQFFQQNHTNLTLSYPTSSQATMDALPSIDSDGSKTIAFLNKINQLLKQTPFELAYRALNELLLSVITHAPQSELELKAVWDDYLMCKVLPRIEGDADKLATKGEQSTLLKSLLTALESEFADFWLSESSRPDLFRSLKNREGANSTLAIECRSKRKMKWMQERLEQSGYCAFWP